MVNIYELLRRNQDSTAEYVSNCLKEMNIDFSIDTYGNIYYLDHEDVPLLSAHMDTVRNDADFCIGAFLTEDEEDKIFSGGILGGDDKCGVYIILKALESGKKVNFIFSRDEEIGSLGIKALLKPNYTENKEMADKVRKCLWCLVLDRRDNHDIICSQNSYGTKEFEKKLEEISTSIGMDYKGARGLCSDADTIKNFISTANISVGYYKPHSQNEYILKSDLEKALNFTYAVIDNVKERFEAAPPTYSYPSYYNNYYNEYYNEYYDYYDTPRANKHLQKNKEINKAFKESPKDDDWDIIDYGDWSDWANNEDNKKNDNELGCCDFCGSWDTIKDNLHALTMPDGEVFHICEFCLEDLESEIKRIRFEKTKI